ncbi:hypothetical protein [Micromonospora sp. NBC_01813]|uniref:hypothetical protein n=1 Tax=Micromonospora sp. NBC_01813 TaxID=2975988 RepID=UPI002DDA436A|nr:hypothetical protein [Micromonospora sp. NBC_01813]WSA08689.1 hypothetical protein OG958_31705 [Micromonospora sp. NBC_01813]
MTTVSSRKLSGVALAVLVGAAITLTGCGADVADRIDDIGAGGQSAPDAGSTGAESSGTDGTSSGGSSEDSGAAGTPVLINITDDVATIFSDRTDTAVCAEADDGSGTFVVTARNHFPDVGEPRYVAVELSATGKPSDTPIDATGTVEHADGTTSAFTGTVITTHSQSYLEFSGTLAGDRVIIAAAC